MKPKVRTMNRWDRTRQQIDALRLHYAELEPAAREAVRRVALREGKWLLQVLEETAQ